MSYTDVDRANANKFADTNVRLRMAKLMYERAPHIVSHLRFRKRRATESDYRVPPGLEHACHVLEIESTEEFCKQLTCNSIKEFEPCKPGERASYYHLGDESHGVQCQPACFNTLPKEQYNDDGTREPETPMLNFARGKCRMMNKMMVAWLEKPAYRSETRFEPLLNNLPTGFTPVPHPYGSGVTYRNNRAYCGYYERNYVPETRTCEMSKLDYFLDAILGNALINAVKASVRIIVTGENVLSMPEHVPPLPTKLEERYTLEGWRKHIDPDFVLPELDDTRPRITTKRNSDNSSNIDLPAEWDERDISDFIRAKAGLPPRDAADEGGEAAEGGEGNGGGGPSAPEDTQAPSGEAVYAKIRQIISGLFESFTTVEGAKMLAISVGTDVAISAIRKSSLKIAQKLAQRLTARVSGKLGMQVVANGLRAVCLRTITSSVIRISLRAGLALAKLTAMASSVVGLLLAFAFVLDFIFALWDPFGYNNLFPATYAADMMANGELQLRHSIGKADTSFGFEQLAKMLLTSEDMDDINLSATNDAFIYLDSLTLNSEGSRIDKGETVVFSQRAMSSTRVEALHQAAAARQFHIDPQSFTAYNERFNRRTELVNGLNRAAGICAGLSVLVALTNLSNLLCVLLLLVAAVLCAGARYSVHNAALLDVYNAHYHSVFHHVDAAVAAY